MIKMAIDIYRPSKYLKKKNQTGYRHLKTLQRAPKIMVQVGSSPKIHENP